MKKNLTFILLQLLMVLNVTGQEKRPLSPQDIYRLQTPSAIQVSPDGGWILYRISKADSVKDKFSSDLWMTNWDGTEHIQLTFDVSGESGAKWSPDGRYISFISKRGDDKYGQVYLLDRKGGEARKLTQVKGDIEEYEWAPDSKQLLMMIGDPSYADTASSRIRKPYVIDRFQFKQDRKGYLDSNATHLYLFNITSRAMDTLTKGIYSESQAKFSPDGKRIAFVSNRTASPDQNENTDLFVMEAKAGALPKKLTQWAGEDTRPVWSPDGKWIAYQQSSSDEVFTMYGQPLIAIIPSGGGEKKIVSASVDRPVRDFHWSKDSKQVFGLMEDDREVQVVSFDISSGKLTRHVTGQQSFSELERNPRLDVMVSVMSNPQVPSEIYAFEGGKLRRLTHMQDSFLAPLKLPKAEGFRSKSKDGTLVSGIMYLPEQMAPLGKLPLILFIHGGPVAQDDFRFDMTRMIYAAAGYAVAAVNYRGSSGRGVEFTRSIYGDWGNKEVMDVIGAADHLVAQGIVDPDKMGLAGWSYGGITTNYTIATDNRFKAAVSGAGSSLQLSMYGSDQYVTQYEKEIGSPWKNPQKWLDISYPFFKADKITTPTLFMASESDFNVPVAGAEQMYQALKSVGVPTGLIIYPGQHHGITVPSYLADRHVRHIGWFDKFLKPVKKAF